MNQNKKSQVIKQIQTAINAEGIDLRQMVMMMGEKGYRDDTVQGFIKQSGMAISEGEFAEVYADLKAIADTRQNEAQAKIDEKNKEEQPPSFADLQNKPNVISNDADLLTKIQKSEPELVSEDFEESMGASLTSAASSDEPTAEELQLPSKGRFYKGILKDKEGRILIRPMTLKEEKIFSNERLLKTGQAMDMVFRNCIKTAGLDTHELLSSDRIFLLFYLRAISYSTVYPVKIVCTNCKTTNEHKIDISKLDIKYPPKELEEPFTCVLPHACKTLILRLARGKDEVDLIKKTYGAKNKQGDAMLDRLKQILLDIEGVPKENWDKTLNSLIGKDLSHIRRTMEVVDFGYKTDDFLECSNCGTNLKIELEINENFFRAR